MQNFVIGNRNILMSLNIANELIEKRLTSQNRGSDISSDDKSYENQLRNEANFYETAIVGILVGSVDAIQRAFVD